MDGRQIALRFAALSPEARRGFLDRLRDKGLSFSELPIVPAEVTGRLALSYSQRSLWLTWRLDPESAAYNIAGMLHFSGNLDEDALRRSLDDLVRRHASLRTVFRADGTDEPEQVVLPAPSMVLSAHDLRPQPDALRARQRDELAAALARQPFGLEREPPFRAALIRLADDAYSLVLAVHHIAADGWSLRILVDELILLYAGHAEGRSVQLPDLPIQFIDYAVWQRNWLEAGELERQLKYWRGRLGTEHAVVTLPATGGRSASAVAGTHAVDLPPATSTALRAVAKQHGASLYMAMLALLKLTLYRFSGQSEIRIGSPIANRQRMETQGLVGYLTNLQVLHTRIDARRDFTHLLAEVRETTLEAYAHQDLPFDLLVEALQPVRQAGVHPLFQVKCTEQAELPVTWNAAGLEIRLEEMPGTQVHFDLSVDFTDRADAIGIELVHSRGLFDEAAIRRFAAALVSLAEQAARSPRRRLADFTLPPPLACLQGEPADTRARLVPALWSACVGRRGKAPALRHEDRVYGYAELDDAAERLARVLQERGVGPEVRVAVLASRTPEFVLGLLAVLKAGGAYIPIDPQLPRDRIAYQLEDSGARLLLASGVPDGAYALPVVAIEFHGHGGMQPVAKAVAVRPHPDQTAYVIYTSGSTGAPKGVMVSHGALANYVYGILARLQLPDDVESMAMVSTTAADLGNTVLFGALCSGRLLHLVAPERAFDPDGFADYMSRHRVDVLKIVPSHLQALLQAGRAADVLPAHTLIVGGESPGHALVERIRVLKPACRIVNHYGPTETTVGILAQAADAMAAGGAALPIGRPLCNARAFVLDTDLNPVAPGVAGELYLGGPGLAHGYLAQPALTAQRFIPDPFGGGSGGSRLYRSGDRARMRTDGSLEFLGRMDDQIKIRGYRVELGEVEAQLLRQAGVREAVVVAQVGAGGARLVGYVSADAGRELDASTLRARLAEALPDYMVPAAVMVLERLPLTANGKVDHERLPDPAWTGTGAYEAPRGEVEEKVAQIWAEVLEIERVGRQDNFFELGGDSILSLRIVARLRRAGWKATPRQLMECQTVMALGEQIVAQSALQPVSPPAHLPILRRGGGGGVEGLSYAQGRLWFLWRL
ncbi:non-ribosomal peptide synthetase, partial [Nitrosovibrio sp. Nv17]|uniref:non-ribosomal peptide synthetase n=1 Tax=Nitrosovibrio sp. Nv17 TaxID=1855339 RepID=UPI0015A6D9B4